MVPWETKLNYDAARPEKYRSICMAAVRPLCALLDAPVFDWNATQLVHRQRRQLFSTLHPPFPLVRSSSLPNSRHVGGAQFGRQTWPLSNCSASDHRAARHATILWCVSVFFQGKSVLNLYHSVSNASRYDRWSSDCARHLSYNVILITDVINDLIAIGYLM